MKDFKDITEKRTSHSLESASGQYHCGDVWCDKRRGNAETKRVSY